MILRRGSFLSFLILLAILVNCSNTQLPSTGGGGSGGSGGGSSDPPVGSVDDSAGFYVKVKSPSTSVTYDIHKGDATYNVDCTAAEGDLSTCYIEGNELDVYHQPPTLHYNVPSTMCHYLNESPYFFYNYPTALGPYITRVDTDVNGVAGLDCDNNGTVDSFSYCDRSGGTAAVKEPYHDIIYAPTCDYDYTASGGPNCCKGYHMAITRSGWNTTTNTYDTVSTSNSVDWGGGAGNCLGGPAMNTQPKTSDGYPTSVDYIIDGTGINKTYTITAGDKVGAGKISNLWIANYFDPTDHGNDTPLPLQLFRTLPSSTDTSYRRWQPVAQPYYRYQCLNAAREIIAEIRVIIREWNTQDAFESRVTAPTMHGVVGNETGNFATYPNNDVSDWKDFEAAGNPYPQGSD